MTREHKTMAVVVMTIATGWIAFASIAADVSTALTKARNFAAIGIAVDADFIVGPLLGGVLSDRSIVPWFSKVLPFWVATALFLINAIAVPFFLRESTPSHTLSVQPARALATTLRDPRLLPAFVISFLTFWSITIFFDFFAVYFVQVFRTPPAELGIYTALISVPLILSGFYVNRFVNRFGIHATGLVAAALMGAGIMWFVIPSTPALLITPIVIVCIGINFGQTATSVIVSDAAPPDEQGQAMGVYRGITVAAAGLSAIVGGVLAGFAPAYPFYTAILSAAIAIALLIIKTQPTQPPHACDNNER
jgi:MFS transporter, DHA1 family, tetracycline resistance protein